MKHKNFALSHLFFPTMPFKEEIKDLVAYRAAHVCSNPSCLRLTAGPSLANSSLKVKIGEAAHIIGEKPTSARHRDLGDAVLNAIENAIWLCASCHTEIDKNKGIDYSTTDLEQWKNNHEERISVILKNHKSPLPLFQRATINATVAQGLVDVIDEHGVFFQHSIYESPDLAIASVDIARKKISRKKRDIVEDVRLKDIGKSIYDACREYMNETSLNAVAWEAYLQVMRTRVGVQLGCLEREYGAIIPVNLGQIVIR
ncbi:hypothetical protein M3I53_35590 [Paraburkholderia sp. CNPSo 3272]|uniref:hypothetical protein n=1 Tax=Paraburkholderia sp. CNPSo 3272 TaxID=2940931 RepID=UPI0020B7DE42|nr:hypothetical protein [Paraburkholderia sp. CNPSo 3272]MCP3728375.1 hypothetical protein [Paraburkholderia sp. CNPSo 3272]